MYSWNRLVLRTRRVGSPLKDYFRYFIGPFFFLMLVAFRTVMPLVVKMAYCVIKEAVFIVGKFY
jgi:hypothetical protein